MRWLLLIVFFIITIIFFIKAPSIITKYISAKELSLSDTLIIGSFLIGLINLLSNASQIGSFYLQWKEQREKKIENQSSAIGLPIKQNQSETTVTNQEDIKQSHPDKDILSPIYFLPDNLPSDYVDRPEIINKIRIALLIEKDSTGTTFSTALHGQGGLGKTIIARAICDDPEIRKKFPDGILWASLGENADIAQQQRNWIIALNGDASLASTIESGKVELRRLLRNKVMLLVLDDVWKLKESRALLVGGGFCQTLLTTRFADQVEDSEIIELDLMQLHESGELLKRTSKTELNENQIYEISARVGYLPLALKIVGAMLARGIPWEDIREALIGSDIKYLSYGTNSVMSTIGASINYLSDEERIRYFELVIFPKGYPICVDAVIRLWQVIAEYQPRFSRKLLANFRDFGLLQNDNRLHDLQYDFLKNVVSVEDSKKWNEILANCYIDEEFWGEPDPSEEKEYVLNRLPYHINSAGQFENLHTLLTNFAFLKTKIEHLGTASVLSDFEFMRTDDLLVNLGKAIQLGAHILNRYPDQLFNQIYGRLGHISELHHIEDQQGASFKLLSHSLTPPFSTKLSNKKGHIGAITCCSFSPDGKLIISSSIDGSIRLWNPVLGESVSLFEGHNSKVNCCTFNNQGDEFLSGSDDCTLRIWDLESKTTIKILEGHLDVIRCCAYSPDGKYIISGSDDRTIRVWDAASGKTIRILKGHKGNIRACGFSPNGQIVLSGSDDSTLCTWDINSGNVINVFTGHNDAIRCCVFNPDGKRILSGSNDRTLRLWDATTGDLIQIIQGHKGTISSCAYNSNGSLILSASWERVMYVWDSSNYQQLMALSGHKGSLNSCAFNPDGNLAISGAWDCTIKMWDLLTGENIKTFAGQTNYVRGCAFSPNGKLAISASTDHLIRLWDVLEKQMIRVFRGHNDYVRSCVFSNDGTKILSSSDDETLKLWDIESGQVIMTMEGHFDAVRACAYHPSKNLALSASWDGTLRLWDLDVGKTVKIFTGHDGRINSCGFNRDGTFCVSASDDRTLRIWNVSTGKTIKILEGHTDYVRSCAFSSNDRYILSASVDGTLKLWDLKTGTNYNLVGHTEYIRSCVFSRNGKYILSASDDCSMRIWDVVSRDEIGHWFADGSIMCCAISNDNLDVIAGDSLNNLHFLSLCLPDKGDL